MLQGKIPCEAVAKRQQYLNSVKKFIDDHEKKLENILQNIGCSTDLQKKERKQVCPYDNNHIVPSTSFAKHVEKCKYLRAGYKEDELESLLQDNEFWYKGCDSIMKLDIDESKLNKIIWDHCVQTGQVYTGHRPLPVSHMDSAIQLTADDRLAVYRHVVQASHSAGKVIPVDKTDELLTTDWGSLVKKGLLNEESNKEFSSKLEQLAVLRDLKRRRQSYRAKNTHITKKSYTEIIREVIVNQMEVLKPPEDVKPDPEALQDCLEQGQRSRDKERRREKHGERRDRHRDRDEDYKRERDGHRDRDKDYKRERDGYRDNDEYFKRERYDRRESFTHRDSDRGMHSKDSRDSFHERDDKDNRKRKRNRGYVKHGNDETEDGEINDDLRARIKEEPLSDDSQEKHRYVDEIDKKKKRKRVHQTSSEDEYSSSDIEHQRSSKEKSSKHKKSKHKKKHSKKHKKK